MPTCNGQQLSWFGGDNLPTPQVPMGSDRQLLFPHVDRDVLSLTVRKGPRPLATADDVIQSERRQGRPPISLAGGTGGCEIAGGLGLWTPYRWRCS
jgi:hypothetical protein